MGLDEGVIKTGILPGLLTDYLHKMFSESSDSVLSLTLPVVYQGATLPPGYLSSVALDL